MVGKFKTKAHKLDQKYKNKIQEEIPEILPVDDVQNPQEYMQNLYIDKISGIDEFESEFQAKNKANDSRTLYSVKDGPVFAVCYDSTVEVRTDMKLSRMLKEKYETVMESRYFGRGGIEIVPSGQLSQAEIEDLIRLSYNLSKESML